MTAETTRRAVLTLYAEAQDPVGHIVRIVLAEKDVTVDVQFITHENRPEDLNDLNPYRSLLTLIDRELVLYDPGVMVEYLDERYPHPPLMPIDPLSRATHRQIRARIMRDLYSQLQVIAEGDEASAAAARSVIRDMLVAIAPAFARQRYFLSDEFSLADCCLGPLLWRLAHLGIKLPAGARILQKYADALFSRPAFAAALSPAERAMHPR